MDWEDKMAKLPPTLMKTASLELRDLDIGDTVYLEPAAMRVTKEMECYLLPTMPFYRERSFIAPSE
jgi:hypothetical protein